ncbi:AAA family ATPase [Cognatiyoonia sp. IB215182]|uniref:AAA family ATPase n=1 Tax=Cognatiyoonia sp. IB215182 TaxID=3097353 RepID=UPI002A1711DC|nr:AAA family ATPase [Cognatiyoonia sp. IB215182]MDX8355274.1 AAA family ATPase [Cognatiyoonia sp. IB215182]
MQLIYLHGPPAVGKLTVASQLVETTGARLFDNHVAIDLARSVLSFEQDGFWELVKRARLLVLETVTQQNVPLVIMTSCYSDPEDRETLEAYEEVLSRFNAKILPVYLQCSEEEMRRRVTNPDRKERRKISSELDLKQFINDTICTPIPRQNCLRLSTEGVSPRDTADRICRHFDLRSR